MICTLSYAKTTVINTFWEILVISLIYCSMGPVTSDRTPGQNGTVLGDALQRVVAMQSLGQCFGRDGTQYRAV